MESRLHNQSKVVPAVFALAGFAVAIACGLAAGNDGTSILLRALGAMFACQFVGMLAGVIVDRVTQQHETSYRADNPVPRASGASVTVVDEIVDESTDGARAAA
jgi:hypothetical protein